MRFKNVSVLSVSCPKSTLLPENPRNGSEGGNKPIFDEACLDTAVTFPFKK